MATLSPQQRFGLFVAMMPELSKVIAAKDWDKAVEICQHQVALVGEFDHGISNYSLARALVRAGRKDDALKALNLAVERGFTNVDRIKNDNSLKSLRDDKRFDEALRKAGHANKQASDASKHYDRKGVPLGKASSLKAGLKWLASQQLKDGSFPASEEFGPTMHFTTAISSLAGMALMTDEQYWPQVEKTLDLILSNVHQDGYIYCGQRPSFKGMWEHGFATQFLAEAVLHMQRDGKDVSAIMPKLRAATALIRRAQNIEGGWGYRALPDPHAEVGPAAAQLDALLLARRAGIEVDQRSISRGLHSQTVLMLPPGNTTFQGEWRSYSYEANAFVLESLLGWKDRPEAKIYLEAVGRVAPRDYFQHYTEQTPIPGAYWSTGNHTLGLYYSALAYRRLGKNYKEQFTHWQEQVCGDLAKCQNSKGAWKGWFGDAFGTALACLTLAADSDALAEFTISDLEAVPSASSGDAKRLAVGGDGELRLGYTIGPSKTMHASVGLERLIADIGLKKDAQRTWLLKDFSPLVPSEPVTVGTTWPVSHNFVQKFFAPFHSTVRGRMECRLIDRAGGRARVGLTALVKFGSDDAKLIQTTCMEGQFELDEAKGTVEALHLDTVSGCSAIKMFGSGGVMLDDTAFHVASQPSAGAAAPAAAPSSKDETPTQQPEKKRGSLGVALGEGAVIQMVAPDSAAAKAGLREGDVIAAIDDRPIKEQADLAAVMGTKAAGDKVRVAFKRDGKERAVDVVLGRAQAPAGQSESSQKAARLNQQLHDGNGRKRITRPR